MKNTTVITIEKTLQNTSRTEYIFKKTKVFNNIKSQLVLVDNKINDLNNHLSQSKQEQETLKHQLERRKKALSQKTESLQDTREELNSFTKIASRQKHKIEDLSEKLTNTIHKNTNLNTSLDSIRLREKIVGRLMNAKNNNPHIQTFDDIFQHDFMDFANEESSLAEEVEAVLKLQDISEELRLIGAFPEFHTKRTVAVAGGFSAGKSAFISSLFSDDTLQLPSSIEPTTAIPTYVFNNEENEPNSLIGVSKNGGTVHLNEIDRKIYGKLTHEFIQEFKFPLKEVMPYMFLTTKLNHQNLCFIDTPGYNPVSVQGISTEHDTEVAKNYTKNAEALIWLVGADANGTIPQSDIDFIQKLNFDKNKPIYFVYNKAELKTSGDLQSVIEHFEHILNSANIPFVGICTYDSVDKEHVSQYKGLTLDQFLTEIDTPSHKQFNLISRIDDIHNMYKNAINLDMKKRGAVKQAISDVLYSLYENSILKKHKEKESITNKLEALESIFSENPQKKQLDNLNKVTQKFVDALNQVFSNEISLEEVRSKKESTEINMPDAYHALSSKEKSSFEHIFQLFEDIKF